MQYQFIAEYRQEYPTTTMCGVPEVLVSEARKRKHQSLPRQESFAFLPWQHRLLSSMSFFLGSALLHTALAALTELVVWRKLIA